MVDGRENTAGSARSRGGTNSQVVARWRHEALDAPAEFQSRDRFLGRLESLAHVAMFSTVKKYRIYRVIIDTP
jgi:hypothetical protein